VIGAGPLAEAARKAGIVDGANGAPRPFDQRLMEAAATIADRSRR